MNKILEIKVNMMVWWIMVMVSLFFAGVSVATYKVGWAVFFLIFAFGGRIVLEYIYRAREKYAN